MRRVPTFLLTALAGLAVLAMDAAAEDDSRRLVIIAGKPSHPPRIHEFNAGVQLLEKCLTGVKGLDVHIVLNGWPKDEAIFEGADAIVFYMDGGGRHEVVQENGRRMKMVDEWTKKGIGIGCMHYGVEVIRDQAGVQFQRWIGGHYENSFSCNPIWEPSFTAFPDHPISNGVKPFSIKDEWYFNMRFIDDLPGNKPAKVEKTSFVPILVAAPSDEVRDGPYVYPKGPYEHIQKAKGRAEAMMWAVERPDGGRGFGFTGGHFHDNWGNDDYRKVVLNSLLWVAQADVPKGGVESSVTKEELDANLDPKKPRKKKS
jgi:type 1 glutamine amidotransferase